MSQSKPIEFPGQEFGNSLGKIQDFLYTAKHLAEQLVPDAKFQETFSDCIKTVQVLLSEVHNSIEDWQEAEEEQAIRAMRLRKKRREDTITEEEEEELAELEQLGY